MARAIALDLIRNRHADAGGHFFTSALRAIYQTTFDHTAFEGAGGCYFATGERLDTGKRRFGVWHVMGDGGIIQRATPGDRYAAWGGARVAARKMADYGPQDRRRRNANS